MTYAHPRVEEMKRGRDEAGLEMTTAATSLRLFCAVHSIRIDHILENLPLSYKLLWQLSCRATTNRNCLLIMSLRGLYQFLEQRTQVYIVRDGRHVFFDWRRADDVHARAKEYLQAKIQGVHSADVKAAQACQDLLDLKLLRCMENNEPKR